MAKAEYSKPASQLDLEARQKDDYEPPAVLKPGVDPALSTNGYVGVDPIYQNAANSTERPIEATKGAEAKVFENFLDEDVEYPKQTEAKKDDADLTPEEPPAGSTPPSGGSTPSGSGSNS
jgi:hypothetical protein